MSTIRSSKSSSGGGLLVRRAMSNILPVPAPTRDSDSGCLTVGIPPISQREGAGMALWCLGVDLGTSFSAGATAAHGRVDILEVDGERRVPSAVLLNEQGTLV